MGSARIRYRVCFRILVLEFRRARRDRHRAARHAEDVIPRDIRDEANVIGLARYHYVEMYRGYIGERNLRLSSSWRYERRNEGILVLLLSVSCFFFLLFPSLQVLDLTPLLSRESREPRFALSPRS